MVFDCFFWEEIVERVESIVRLNVIDRNVVVRRVEVLFLFIEVILKSNVEDFLIFICVRF